MDLATHQLAMTLWTFLAFVLDAIAIAAQAITGRYLGAGDVAATRAVTSRMVRWGVVGGVVTGLLLAVASPVLGALFTDDRAVQDLLVPVLVVAALGQPVAGVVFVLDGVLIGAGDGAYLARGGLVTLAVYAPLALAAALLGAGWSGSGSASPPSSWAPGSSCCSTAPAATPGSSPASASRRGAADSARRR